jgi:hypothetical protein
MAKDPVYISPRTTALTVRIRGNGTKLVIGDGVVPQRATHCALGWKSEGKDAGELVVFFRLSRNGGPRARSYAVGLTGFLRYMVGYTHGKRLKDGGCSWYTEPGKPKELHVKVRLV